MELRKALRIVLAYWFVVAAGLCATGAAVVLVSARVTPTYEAMGSLIILPPTEVAGGKQNPYTRFDSASSTTAVAMLAIIKGQSFALRMEQLGFAEDSFEIGMNPGSGGAIMDVRVAADEPGAALAQWTTLVSEVQSILAAQQEATGAPSESFISARELVSPVSAERVSGSPSRAALAVGVLGLTVSLSCAFLLDSLLPARRPHRRSSAVQPIRAPAGENGSHGERRRRGAERAPHDVA
jgi:hypothetical protein